MKLNEKLYELRRKKHLSQEQLAQELDLSRQAISKWEKGDNKPDLDNLKKLADIFNVKIEYLIDDEATDEEVTVPTQNSLNKKIIVSFVLSACLCFVLGFFFGNKKADSEIVANFLNSPKLVTNFDSPAPIDNNLKRTLEIVPSFYHSSLNVEYVVVNKDDESKQIYPAHYENGVFTSEEIKFDYARYSIYVCFKAKSIEKTLLLADDFQLRNDSSQWTNNWMMD